MTIRKVRLSKLLRQRFPIPGHQNRIVRFRKAGSIYSLEISVAIGFINKGKGKGTVHPRTGHEGPEGE